MTIKDHIQQRQRQAFWSLPQDKPTLRPYAYILIPTGLGEDQYKAFKREWEKARGLKEWSKPIILPASCEVMMVRTREEELEHAIRNLAA